MKHLLSIFVLAAVLLVGSVPAAAAVYTYTPYDDDLGDLDHYYAYSWKVNWTHTSETITAASLTFRNMYDWVVESNDTLWVNLLNSPPSGTNGIRTFLDNQNPTNYFAAWDGALVGTWSDPLGEHSHGDVTLNFDPAAISRLNTFAADGLFGIGLDPDCHYYNTGISLAVTTTTPPGVPEPASMMLVGLGLVGLGVIRRRK